MTPQPPGGLFPPGHQKLYKKIVSIFFPMCITSLKIVAALPQVNHSPFRATPNCLFPHDTITAVLREASFQATKLNQSVLGNGKQLHQDAAGLFF